MDRARIEALIAQNYAGLRFLIKRRAGDPDVAADILNAAVSKAWENWQAGKISNPEQIAGYVYQVAMNLLRNHRRSTFSRPEKRATPETLDSLASADDSTDEWTTARLAAEVRRIVESLPQERDRTIVKRFYLDEEEKQTICREMNLEPTQFDKVLFRARNRLRELLTLRGLKRADLFVICLA